MKLNLKKRPRVKRRSDLDKRINDAYKQLTRNEVKAFRIGLEMRQLPPMQ